MWHRHIGKGSDTNGDESVDSVVDVAEFKMAFDFCGVKVFCFGVSLSNETVNIVAISFL